jgi:quinohemoprotein amine dehydrogenase
MRHLSAGLSLLFFAGMAAAQSSEEGIPVTDPLVIAKCGACHASDARGNMQRISWSRTTPEGWQDVLKDMIVMNGLSVTPEEARPIVKYLSTTHGLAPEESRPVMFDAERRVREETNIPTDSLRTACARCHSFTRALSWRRSREEWKQFSDSHARRYQVRPSVEAEAIAFLTLVAPLHTAEWDAWSTRTDAAPLTGRWLVTARMPGRGQYYGEMQVDRAGEDEFATRVNLTSVKDGSKVLRTGRSTVYGGTAWRGRSAGSSPVSPDDPSSEGREVLWIAADHSSAEGRWFWGQYQEFGFDVKVRRPAPGPMPLLVDHSSFKVGSRANRVRVIGQNFPAQVTPADLKMGPGVTVRAIVSNSTISNNMAEIVAEVDVAADAQPGKRDVALGGSSSVLAGAIAVYDRIDFLKVTPESAMAAFGDAAHPRGFQQFEAIGYQRGPDGKVHTADDVELGPVDVTWALQVFHAPEGSSSDFVGNISPSGLLSPSTTNPNINFDTWVIATAKGDKGTNGELLVGKAYVVITVPTYAFNGRQYVRDLDRWVDDGTAQPDRGQADPELH